MVGIRGEMVRVMGERVRDRQEGKGYIDKRVRVGGEG